MKCICVNISNPSAVGIQSIPIQEDSQISLFGGEKNNNKKTSPPNLMQTAIKASG